MKFSPPVHHLHRTLGHAPRSELFSTSLDRTIQHHTRDDAISCLLALTEDGAALLCTPSLIAPELPSWYSAHTSLSRCTPSRRLRRCSPALPVDRRFKFRRRPARCSVPPVVTHITLTQFFFRSLSDGGLLDCPGKRSCEQQIGGSAESIAAHMEEFHADKYLVKWGSSNTQSASRPRISCRIS